MAATMTTMPRRHGLSGASDRRENTLAREHWKHWGEHRMSGESRRGEGGDGERVRRHAPQLTHTQEKEVRCRYDTHTREGNAVHINKPRAQTHTRQVQQFVKQLEASMKQSVKEQRLAPPTARVGG